MIYRVPYYYLFLCIMGILSVCSVYDNENIYTILYTHTLYNINSHNGEHLFYFTNNDEYKEMLTNTGYSMLGYNNRLMNDTRKLNYLKQLSPTEYAIENNNNSNSDLIFTFYNNDLHEPITTNTMYRVKLTYIVNQLITSYGYLSLSNTITHPSPIDINNKIKPFIYIQGHFRDNAPIITMS